MLSAGIELGKTRRESIKETGGYRGGILSLMVILFLIARMWMDRFEGYVLLHVYWYCYSLRGRIFVSVKDHLQILNYFHLFRRYLLFCYGYPIGC